MPKFLEGLVVTLKTALRKPVTAEYPNPEKRIQPAERFMGFPALLWDYDVAEPYCTGCMVCIRNCPTQCMTATMQDNPKFDSGESRRRKIIEEFEINLGRCILCGICVDVCNFDAIEMSHEHELSKYERDGNRADLVKLLELGKTYQAETGWQPTNPEKNSGAPKADTKPAESKHNHPAPLDFVSTERKAEMSEMTKEERLAAARARAKAKRDGESQQADTSKSEVKSGMSNEERVAAAKARAQAKQDGANHETTSNSANSTSQKEMTKEERVAAARERAKAKRESSAQDSPNAGQIAVQTVNVGTNLNKPKEEMTKEERVAAARARAKAKRESQPKDEDEA